MISTDYVRKNQLTNIRAILNQKYELTAYQCNILSQCLDILSKETLTKRDNLMIDKLLARGRFGVVLPY